MDPRVQEILDNATDLQQDYVIARLTHSNPSKAAKALGLNRSSAFNWDNLEELEEAVRILRRNAVEAGRLALENLVLDAVATLGGVMGGKSAAAINAAKAILNRAGLPAQTNVDLTSKGEQIKATVYIPDNGRDDTG